MFKSKHISLAAKRAAYVACVQSILLYGSECWAITRKMERKLAAFHHRCARAMFGITMWHVEKQGITTEFVLEKLGLRSVQIYLARRRLRWIGHVSRMHFDRLPRKFLSSWVYQARPLGRPHLRWAESIKRDLQLAKLPITKWAEKAQDKAGWHDMIKFLGEPKGARKRRKRSAKRKGGSQRRTATAVAD